MTIKSLSLQNFRSFSKKIFEFSPFTTFILGANATGKTTILEAIALLSTGKGFRTGSDTEIIAFDKEVGRVSSIIEGATELVEKERESEEKALEIVLTRGVVMGVKTPLKKYTVNGIPRRSFDFAGTLLSVLFSPSDLELITDSPSIRRRYLDHVLIQADREYRRNLSSYERGVRQRNKVLEAIRDEGADHRQLVFWDQLLIKAGSYITSKRKEFIEFVNSYKIPLAESENFLSYSITYDLSIISEERLFQYENAEIASATTLVGPHRDDLIFTIGKNNTFVFFRNLLY
jgi:DNA replication and repair protein RecF